VARAIDKGMLFVGIAVTAFERGAGANRPYHLGRGRPWVRGSVWRRRVNPTNMAACFDDLLSGQGRVPGGGSCRRPDRHLPKMLLYPSANDPTATGVGASSASKSTLSGGNLAVLTALLGSPYFPQVKGGLLFLEDVAEHPYRIETHADPQLLHAGALSQQRAIILGQFTDYKARSPRPWLQVADGWWTGYAAQLKIPVLTDLPLWSRGHQGAAARVAHNAQLLVDGRDAMLYWG